MRLRRFRIGIRGLMVAVAIAAGLLGWRQHRIYEALRLEYESEADLCGWLRDLAQKRGSLTQEEWLEICRWVDRTNQEGTGDMSGGIRVLLLHPDPPELERRQAEYWGRRQAKYERAALRPWLAVEPDEDEPR